MLQYHTNIARHLYDALLENKETSLFEDFRSAFSRGRFLQMVAWRQKALEELVSPGDMVIVKAERGASFFVDILAVWGLGGVIVPLSPGAEQQYVDHVMTTVEPVAVLEESLNMEDITGESPVCLELVAGSTAAILFTSGSTGTPKGVVLTHEVIAGNSFGILGVLQMKNERLLTNIPFNFTSAICHFIACVLSGSTLIGIEDKLFFNDLIGTAREMNATGFGGAPIQLKWMAQTYQGMEENGDRIDVRLRFVVSSGDHLPVETISAWRKAVPETQIFTVYGLTELGGRFTVLDAADIEDHAGSVGKPIKGLSAAVVDFESGGKVGPGEEGEIVASGELLCKEYYREPVKTEQLFSRWGVRTGDIGYIDEAGFIYITGRADDVFKVNGQKVAATVISDALLELPVFADAAAISIETDAFGTVPAAAFVTKEGQEFKKGEVLKELRAKLPANHIPQRFVALSEIPRTPSGKVERATLRKKILETGE